MKTSKAYALVITLVALLFPAGGFAQEHSALRFNTFILKDDQGGSGEVATMLIPAGWQTEGGMKWDLGNAYPAQTQIRTIGEMSRIMAQESSDIQDTTRQEFEAHNASQDAIAEGWSETTRGETPWDAGDGNKVLLPADYGRAWRDGNGQYIVSNDGLYDPNTDPNNNHATWTPMDALQH